MWNQKEANIWTWRIYPTLDRFYLNPDRIYPNPERLYLNPDRIYPNQEKLYLNPDRIYPNPESRLYLNSVRIYPNPERFYLNPDRIYPNPVWRDNQPVRKIMSGLLHFLTLSLDIIKLLKHFYKLSVCKLCCLIKF